MKYSFRQKPQSRPLSGNENKLLSGETTYYNQSNSLFEFSKFDFGIIYGQSVKLSLSVKTKIKIKV